MKDYVEDINDYMDSKDFLTQAGIEFLRDAWIGSRFAIQRGAELVRLVMDEWLDFEIRSGARIECFEYTEADQGRRRGDEYRKAETIAGPNGFILEDDPVENWIERASQVPRILQMAIEIKTSKHYGSWHN
jgi:hypothetical protein